MKEILKIGGFVALAVLGTMQVLERRSAKTWPSVDGVITSSRIDTTTRTRNTGGEGVRHSQVTRYEVHAGYRYEVNGERYTGNRIEIGRTSFTMRRSAERELANYPVGKVVTVYYNPEKPDKSTLQR